MLDGLHALKVNGTVDPTSVLEATTHVLRPDYQAGDDVPSLEILNPRNYKTLDQIAAYGTFIIEDVVSAQLETKTVRNNRNIGNSMITTAYLKAMGTFILGGTNLQSRNTVMTIRANSGKDSEYYTIVANCMFSKLSE